MPPWRASRSLDPSTVSLPVPPSIVSALGPPSGWSLPSPPKLESLPSAFRIRRRRCPRRPDPCPSRRGAVVAIAAADHVRALAGDDVVVAGAGEHHLVTVPTMRGDDTCCCRGRSTTVAFLPWQLGRAWAAAGSAREAVDAAAPSRAARRDVRGTCINARIGPVDGALMPTSGGLGDTPAGIGSHRIESRRDGRCSPSSCSARTEIPTSWVNLLADLPGDPPPPPLSPATGEPAGPGRPGADLPDGADRAGGLDRSRYRDPGGGPRRLPALAADPAAPRPAPGARARYPGAHLLQVRGRLPGRLPQAEHRGRAGLLQPRGRDPEDLDRDRRGPVGLGDGARLSALRPRVRGLHGRDLLRPEALPQGDDRDLGRDGPPQPLGPDRGRPLPGRARTPAASGSRSPRRSRSPPRLGGHQLLARLGAQPRLPAPDRDRPGVHRADGDGGGGAGRGDRLRRRRLQLRRRRLSVPAPAAARGHRDPLRRAPSRPPARR